MLLVLDNYDSFTYNIVQYAGELGVSPEVRRNDALSVEGALAMAPRAIIVSPGPCTPSEAGISVPLVRAAGQAGIPVLGVCLGHQAIGEAFGVFHGVPTPLTVMRYHSLVIHPDSLPAELEVTAWSGDRPAGREIMGVRHRSLPVEGVQFHPESVGTAHGRILLANFLRAAGFEISPLAVPA